VWGSCWCRAVPPAATAIAVLVATYALTNLSDNQSWRAALLFGGLPIFLMIFIRRNAGIAAVERIRTAAQERRVAAGEGRRAHVDFGDPAWRLTQIFPHRHADVRRLHYRLSGDFDLYADFDDPRPARQSRRGAHGDADLVGIFRRRAPARRACQRSF